MWATPRGSVLPIRDDFLKIRELVRGILRTEQYSVFVAETLFFPVYFSYTGSGCARQWY